VTEDGRRTDGGRTEGGYRIVHGISHVFSSCIGVNPLYHYITVRVRVRPCFKNLSADFENFIFLNFLAFLFLKFYCCF
jgi:hypothetical protein